MVIWRIDNVSKGSVKVLQEALSMYELNITSLLSPRYHVTRQALRLLVVMTAVTQAA